MLPSIIERKSHEEENCWIVPINYIFWTTSQGRQTGKFNINSILMMVITWKFIHTAEIDVKFIILKRYQKKIIYYFNAKAGL